MYNLYIANLIPIGLLSKIGLQMDQTMRYYIQLYISVFLLSLILLPNSLSAEPGNDVDSLLSIQNKRAGKNSEQLFGILESELTPEAMKCARFLLSYMPLSDLASLSSEYLYENIMLALEAKNEMDWGKDINDELFMHFVLPHRVAQEPAVRWRKPFYEELSQRVKGMSMTEAALEINLWCLEHATFKQTTGWDQDALTTIKTGYGRCEEEMNLTICALRSVGIPARPCATPFWAHSDNNHAWVEVWADGKWWFMGGCEPAYELNRAWFKNPAKRAALVVNTAYGHYEGSEEVLKLNPRSTILNSTPIYTDCKELNIRIKPESYLPVEGQKCYFMLVNFGGLLPLTSLITDDSGVCSITTGLTDWVVWCGSNDTLDWKWIPASQTDTVFLSPEPLPEEDWSWSLDMHPPPAPEIEKEEATDTEIKNLWKARKSHADSLRMEYASIWADTARIDSISNVLDIPFEKIAFVLDNAKGNWQEVIEFLLILDPKRRELGLIFLEDLHDGNQRYKDLRTLNSELLADHFRAIENAPDMVDSSRFERFRKYVLYPRIDHEHIGNWRELLETAFSDEDLAKVHEMVADHFTLEEDRDRLSSQLSPEQAFITMHGTERDFNSLLVAIHRSLGIPSRLQPVTGKPQIWEDGDWKILEISSDDKQPEATESETGVLYLDYKLDVIEQPLCYRHWTLSRLQDNYYDFLEFDYLAPIGDNHGPHELPAGRYLLCGANRNSDGDVLAHLQFFNIGSGDTLTKQLVIRDFAESSEVIDVVIDPPSNLIPLTKWGTNDRIRQFPENGLVLFWVEPNAETTERMLDDFESIPGNLLLDNRKWALVTERFPGEKFLKRMLETRIDWELYIDPGYGQLTRITDQLKSTGSFWDMPVLICVDEEGRIVGYNSGLRFGITEDIGNWFDKGR
ncbi:MAG: hypothetical protein GF315_10260 [candidate division Zixibacteria bacterium]|nr:hypothetical protein [candidate division Zixibacteria bacterium]